MAKRAVDELNLPDSRPGKHLNTAFDKISAQALGEINKKDRNIKVVISRNKNDEYFYLSVFEIK